MIGAELEIKSKIRRLTPVISPKLEAVSAFKVKVLAVVKEPEEMIPF